MYRFNHFWNHLERDRKDGIRSDSISQIKADRAEHPRLPRRPLRSRSQEKGTRTRSWPVYPLYPKCQEHPTPKSRAHIHKKQTHKLHRQNRESEAEDAGRWRLLE